LLENSSLDRYLYNISIFTSFHSRDFSTFEIEISLSRSIVATAIANSGRQTITSSIIPKFLTSFGKTVVTKIAIFQLILSLSSLSFITQVSCQDFVFLLSQTMIQTCCQKLFLTI